MALESSMLPLGTKAPDFQLLDVKTQKIVSLNELKSNTTTLVMFICNHCPFVKHLQQALIKLALDYQPKGVSVVAISSNDSLAYPDDSPANMKKIADEFHYPFPYLFDETQDVARAYHAVCTPDFFLFDKNLKCIYRGQFDGSTPRNEVPITGENLRLALDCVLSGKPVHENQKPSIGCGIKWRAN